MYPILQLSLLTRTLSTTQNKIPRYERFALVSRRILAQEETTRVPDEVSALNAGAKAALEHSNRQLETMAASTEHRLAALEEGQKQQIAAGLTTNLLLQQLISLQQPTLSNNAAGGKSLNVCLVIFKKAISLTFFCFRGSGCSSRRSGSAAEHERCFAAKPSDAGTGHEAARVHGTSTH
jgi:hypothetical protein